MLATMISLLASRSILYRGNGYFSGLGPDPADPDSADGRFRKLNVPGQGRIVAYDRSSMQAVASTLSNPDGTWRIDALDPDRFYTVIGWDDAGVQNAAIQDWVKPALPE